MLELGHSAERNCQGLHRRSLLQLGSLGGLGLSLPSLLSAESVARAAGRATSNFHCIFIWTQGGTSHHDTFDPKPLAPDAVRGPYSVIDTAVPGVQFTEIVPRMARELGRFSLLRGWNPKNGSHGTADQYVMSGRPFNPAFTYPCCGSVVSHQLGFASKLPPFVQVGGNIDRRFGGGSPGVLGMTYGAFEILSDPSQPAFSVRDVTPPAGIASERVDRRQAMLARLDAVQRRADLQPRLFDTLDDHTKSAISMITSPETKRAFRIEDEEPRLRDRYGRNKFGQGLLLARRLIESGVRFVTVTDGGWDTHQNNFDSLKNRLVPPVDQALPELLIDLSERGLLDSTLVVWATDFGRTPKINSASGRDHWSTSGFLIAAGAGIQGGTVIGATDGEGGVVTRDEHYSEDLVATMYARFGVANDLIVIAPDGRPVRLNEGRPIRPWLGA